MRPYTDFEAKNVKLLVDRQINFASIQITETGLKKSILDATAPVRTYLKENGLHDYTIQPQGPEHKRSVSTIILTETSYYKTATSFYRPNTKNGDPRMWINKTKGFEFLKANDIFAIIIHNSILYAVNLTNTDITKAINSPIITPLKDLILELSSQQQSVSRELLTLIKTQMTDWTPTDIHADTGIGRKVETVLGIDMNASKEPDYKGIELKSHRIVSKVRNALFTQSPDWSISKLKSGKEIVNKYGYIPDGYSHKSLHVTLSATRPNTQGLGLAVIQQTDLLEVNEYCLNALHNGSHRKIADVAAWQLSKLHERLLTKHHETFWIDAETKIVAGKEFFRVTEILHTKNPIPSQFDILLEQGDITVDLLLYRKSGGDTYSFKIKSKSRPLLFPESDRYIFNSPDYF